MGTIEEIELKFKEAITLIYTYISKNNLGAFLHEIHEKDLFHVIVECLDKADCYLILEYFNITGKGNGITEYESFESTYLYRNVASALIVYSKRKSDNDLNTITKRLINIEDGLMPDGSMPLIKLGDVDVNSDLSPIFHGVDMDDLVFGESDIDENIFLSHIERSRANAIKDIEQLRERNKKKG